MTGSIVAMPAATATADYSFTRSTAYSVTDKMTVFQGTTLVWGIEPS